VSFNTANHFNAWAVVRRIREVVCPAYLEYHSEIRRCSDAGLRALIETQAAFVPVSRGYQYPSRLHQIDFEPNSM
jgi:hypothetical protein